MEYIDFLQDAVEHPVEVRDGCYVTPTAPGWGLEFRPEFIAQHRYPEGVQWKDRPTQKKGVQFEAN